MLYFGHSYMELQWLQSTSTVSLYIVVLYVFCYVPQSGQMFPVCPLAFPLPRPLGRSSSSSLSTLAGGSAGSQGSKARCKRQPHKATASSGPSKLIASQWPQIENRWITGTAQGFCLTVQVPGSPFLTTKLLLFDCFIALLLSMSHI